MTLQPRDLAPSPSDLDAMGITTLRMLSVDGVESANAGHPGLPLGMAPTAWVLWRYLLRLEPSNHRFELRDRFVLSAGHGSMLLYSLLHLFGYDVTIEDLSKFRSIHSRTPGHPEHGMTDGVETSTGPLGQGVGNAVGMAIGAREMAGRFGVAQEDLPRVFAICSDGDLMEGISNEASSLAGHLKLSNLFLIYDNNSISIDGSTGLAFTEDVVGRYSALGWRTVVVDDGNDHQAIRTALEGAVADVDDRPTFISVRTIIGFGAPTKAGTAKVHGAPLGKEEMAGLRSRFGWPEEPFYIPTEVSDLMGEILKTKEEDAKARRARNSEALQRYATFCQGDLSAIADNLPSTVTPGESVASRVASKRFLTQAAPEMPSLILGTADLGESTGLDIPSQPVTPSDVVGNYLHYGVREHAMGAVMNGLALFGGFHVAGSTFLVFSDYMRGSIRLAAIMGLPVTYVFTHDSIGVGEDGPTHQPIEQLDALRVIPHLRVIRPSDANETVEAWKSALSSKDHPVALILSRQGLPDLGDENLSDLRRYGARVLYMEQGSCDVVLVGSGSETSLLVDARASLAEGGVHGVRVVSMPERERFLSLDRPTRASLIPEGAVVVTLEAGVTMGWERVCGDQGAAIGINEFGHSGKGPDVFKEMGITAAAVVAKVQELLAN